MQSSFNTLVIESLTLETVDRRSTLSFSSKLKASLNFTCPGTKNTFMRFRFQTQSGDYSRNDCLKECIENFMNGRFYDERIEIEDCDTKCITERNKVHAIDIQLEEPFRSLFEDLFDLSKWKIPKELSGTKV